MKTITKILCLVICFTMLIGSLISCNSTEETPTQNSMETKDSSNEKTALHTTGTNGLGYKLLDNDTYGVFIGDAFEIEEIIIPSTYQGKAVTRILEDGFSSEVLKSIVIPDSVITIDQEAFYYCENLENITLGNNVQYIGAEAFIGSAKLKSITIPSSVISIGYGAFADCNNLTNITVEANNTMYHTSQNCLIETNTKTLIWGSQNSIIPTDGSVTSIGSLAFFGCCNLTSITLPDCITNIGEYAFCWCLNLTSIVIPDSVTTIEGCAFDTCKNLTNIKLPKNLTNINYSTFADCISLKSIIIPKSIKSIDFYAFSDCNSLIDIYFMGTKSEWSAIEKSDAMIPQNVTIHFNYVSTES